MPTHRRSTSPFSGAHRRWNRSQPSGPRRPDVDAGGEAFASPEPSATFEDPIREGRVIVAAREHRPNRHLLTIRDPEHMAEYTLRRCQTYCNDTLKAVVVQWLSGTHHILYIYIYAYTYYTTKHTKYTYTVILYLCNNYIYIYIHVYICVYICVYIYIYIYIYT